MSLTFQLGFFVTSFAQVIKLDTIIALPFEAFSENYTNLFVYNSQVYFSQQSEITQFIDVYNISTSFQQRINISQTSLTSLSHTLIINNEVVFGSSIEAFRQKLDAGFFEALEIDLKLTSFASAKKLVTLENYPDYFNPQPKVPFEVYDSNYSLMFQGELPFDFPNYFARVGSFFAIQDSLLVYCMATNYECYMLNLNSFKLSNILHKELNDKSAQAKIEAVKTEVMQPRQQAQAWLRKLQELDKEIIRIERVLFDGNQILVVKRMPDSEWDYRLVDIYSFENMTATLIASDCKVESVPSGKLSFSNPPSFIMDSHPILFHNSKLYMICQFDYSKGFKEGIEAEEFTNNLNRYYENNIPKYAVYIYSIGACDTDR